MPRLSPSLSYSRPTHRSTASTPVQSDPEPSGVTDNGPISFSDESRNMDLVTGILGVQIDARAPTVEWTSGQRTVLPFLPKRDKRRRMRNLLNNDARYTRDLAKLPEAGPHSSQVSFLDKNLDGLELVKLAQEALSQDKVVVVRGYVDTHGFQFNVEDLNAHFSVTPHRPVQAHGRSKS